MNSIYFTQMTVSVTDITTNNEKLINGKESVTKKDMTMWCKEIQVEHSGHAFIIILR